MKVKQPWHHPGYRKFYEHRAQAIRSGKNFTLTFEQWWQLWQDSGHWSEIGKNGRYHMVREGGINSDWTLDNVLIVERGQSAFRMFCKQRSMNLSFGVSWKLTFQQWQQVWQDSGHWSERGCRHGQYVMARIQRYGAYEMGNVRIIIHEQVGAEVANYNKRIKGQQLENVNA